MTKSSRARKSPRKARRASNPGRPRSGAGEGKARLFDAALTVFAERGYSAATTAEIITAAGVSKPVLYHHGGSKAGLFRQLVGGIYEAGLHEWEAALAAEKGAETRLRALARLAFAGCARDPRIPRLLFQTYYGPRVAELGTFLEELTARRFALIVRVMTDALAARELRGGTAESLALAWCCLVDQPINILSRLPHPAAHLTPALADSLAELFLHGVAVSFRKNSSRVHSATGPVARSKG